jgi:hypothetical protein
LAQHGGRVTYKHTLVDRGLCIRLKMGRTDGPMRPTLDVIVKSGLLSSMIFRLDATQYPLVTPKCGVGREPNLPCVDESQHA